MRDIGRVAASAAASWWRCLSLLLTISNLAIAVVDSGQQTHDS
jgi:hypothetical protein